MHLLQAGGGTFYYNLNSLNCTDCFNWEENLKLFWALTNWKTWLAVETPEATLF